MWFVRRQYRQRTPRNRVSGALTRVHISRTIKGARVSIVPEMKIILVFRLVASLGKYALENEMRICIDLVFLENGLAVLHWRSGK